MLGCLPRPLKEGGASADLRVRDPESRGKAREDSPGNRGKRKGRPAKTCAGCGRGLAEHVQERCQSATGTSVQTPAPGRDSDVERKFRESSASDPAKARAGQTAEARAAGRGSSGPEGFTGGGGGDGGDTGCGRGGQVVSGDWKSSRAGEAEGSGAEPARWAAPRTGDPGRGGTGAGEERAQVSLAPGATSQQVKGSVSRWLW